MAKVELVMPKMGESIMEATILKWAKSIGDRVAEDETILEIATDKVDSEIPSPIDGVLVEILHQEDDVVPVGKVIAIIQTEGEETVTKSNNNSEPAASATPSTPSPQPIPSSQATGQTPAPSTMQSTESTRFYSPLVKSIAKKEGISAAELETITGSGANGRVNKNDILQYINHRKSNPTITSDKVAAAVMGSATAATTSLASGGSANSLSGASEIVEMGRMRKLIADHMVMSKKTSPHVTSFVEADVTNLVNWRNKNKAAFQSKYGEKITFTPLIMEAVIKAIKDYPLINVTVVDGDKIKILKDINIGMAAALPTGNLIVPVIKNADYLNLAGLTKSVNDLAKRARENKLKPDEVQGGTFTLTNVGTFGNVMGTPIINQPQVAILAAGAIRKKPAVLETDFGDVIAVRQMMFLSHSYDHRVVDGFLGGSFVRRVADYLENFDVNKPV